MTPEQYKMRATLEAALKVQAEQVPVDEGSLLGCLMVAVQLAHSLQLSSEELQTICGEEHTLWQEYLTLKQRIIAKRRADAGGGKK